jgi:hypothetical protein
MPVARALGVVTACALAVTALLGGVSGPPAPLWLRLLAFAPLAAVAVVGSGLRVSAVRRLLAPA